MHKSSYRLLWILPFLLLSACGEKTEVKSSGAKAPAKAKIILINNRSPEGNYYLDKRTEAQVFIPKGMSLELKSFWPNWGNNFLVKNAADDFKIYIRFDATAKEDEEMAQCKQALLDSPIPNMDPAQMKVYPFLSGEFNADIIVTTDKAQALASPSTAKANLFQIRKKTIGCYTFLFIYENEASLGTYSTEKELMEYVRFP